MNYRLTHVIKVYEGESNLMILKIAEVVNSCLSSFSFMCRKDQESLVGRLGLKINGAVKYQHSSSYDILSFDFNNGVMRKLEFTFNPGEVTLNIQGCDPIRVRLPKMMIRILNGNVSHIFFIKEERKKVELYSALLPNVSDNGSLCLGSVDFKRMAENVNINECIENIITCLFLSTFTHNSFTIFTTTEKLVEEIRKGKFYNPKLKVNEKDDIL